MWRTTILLDKNPKKIDIYDKRFNPPFIVSKPDGQNVDLLLQDVDKIAYNNKKIDYFTPNIVSLQFSIAEKSLEDAKYLINLINKVEKTGEVGSDEFDRKALINNSKLVCDYIEKVQTAIVFSFTAAETFSNLSIPNDYEYIESKNKCSEIYNKFQIERWINWKTKFFKILTEIYGTKPIIEQPFWSSFCELVKIRDKTIHQKSMKDTEYLELFFKPRIFDICSSARQVVMFFKDSTKENYKQKQEMVGKEYIWPILDEKDIILGVTTNIELRLGE